MKYGTICIIKYAICILFLVLPSVGGTLGMFIGFSMDGVVSRAISYIKKHKTQ